jgi:hypothetical protein
MLMLGSDGLLLLTPGGLLANDASCCCEVDCCASLAATLYAKREWLTGCKAGDVDYFTLVGPGIWTGSTTYGDYSFTCVTGGTEDDWVLSVAGCPSVNATKHITSGNCSPMVGTFEFSYTSLDLTCPVSCNLGFFAGSYRITIQETPF